MGTVTLSEAKAQCRITNSLEDTLIQIYIDAADDWIANYLNTSNFTSVAAIKAAALLIVHDLYDNRGATGDKDFKPNPAVERLLFPYRENMGV